MLRRPIHRSKTSSFDHRPCANGGASLCAWLPKSPLLCGETETGPLADAPCPIHCTPCTKIVGAILAQPKSLVYADGVEKFRRRILSAIFGRARARGRTDDSICHPLLNQCCARAALNYSLESFSTVSAISEYLAATDTRSASSRLRGRLAGSDTHSAVT